MKKVDLIAAAGEFEAIGPDTHLFYNKQTGEFDYFCDFMDAADADIEKYEDDAWVAAPSQRDLGEYDIMSDFADTVADPLKNDLLCDALEGRGAFRRFKDTLRSVGLEDEWYDFRRLSFAKVAKEWCDDNGIEYTNYIEDISPEPSEPAKTLRPDEIAVTLATLESHNHIVGDVERGVKLYKSGGVEFEEQDDNAYWARVPHKHGRKFVAISFADDGEDIKKHYCDCTSRDRRPPVCRHVVAAVLAIQGRVVESKLTLGKTFSVNAQVTASNTAKAVGSGSLDVFATPMMIALMEQAACKCLEEGLEPGQTSVGTEISASHTAASPLGAEITATATIGSITGRKIGFAVSASDQSGEIGNGKHTRVIVDEERFMEKTEARLGG